MLLSIVAAVLLLSAPQQSQPAQTPQPGGQKPAGVRALDEELWEAARAGDTKRVASALQKGADVNAKTRYGATALTFAADRGHIEVVKLLIDRGADVDARDSFYQMRAVDMAMSNSHLAVVELLLQKGSKGAAGVLMFAVQSDNTALAKLALASPEITRANVASAISLAKRSQKTQVLDLLNEKLAKLPADAAPAVTVERSTLQTYVGTYRNESSGLTVNVALKEDQLTAIAPGGTLTLIPTSPSAFRVAERDGFNVSFQGRGGTIKRMVVVQNNATQVFERVAADASPAPSGPASTATAPAAPLDPDATRPAPRTAPRPWPAFRGSNAAGVADGQGAVVEWDLDTKQHILWTTPIPGISNASPIVSGSRIFVVTAVSSAGDKTFRTGLYGDVAPVNDLSEHTWMLYALDKNTGKVLWERTAFKGMPKVKRHTKASQANSTPVTDGKRVVALFGSIGMLAAWDVDGNPLWSTDVGVLDSGWFFDPEYQWGHSSSPIIHGNAVIVQADRQKNSFIAAYDLESGKEIWRTDRDEIPTWGTPTVFASGDTEQIVTNGPKIRAYDPKNGALLWTLEPNSEVTVGTPVVGDGLVFVTGGYPPARPIYAVKPTARGDIRVKADTPPPDALAWNNGEGTYIPSPLVYQGILYACNNNGVLTAYDAKTGERIYRARVGGGGSFSASPIAADGRLYLANEDGDVYVVRAGRTYQELAKNEMQEVIMATPAISDGVIVIRTLGHLYGVGTK